MLLHFARCTADTPCWVSGQKRSDVVSACHVTQSVQGGMARTGLCLSALSKTNKHIIINTAKSKDKRDYIRNPVVAVRNKIDAWY